MHTLPTLCIITFRTPHSHWRYFGTLRHTASRARCRKYCNAHDIARKGIFLCILALHGILLNFADCPIRYQLLLWRHYHSLISSLAVSSPLAATRLYFQLTPSTHIFISALRFWFRDDFATPISILYATPLTTEFISLWISYICELRLWHFSLLSRHALREY
jgi:hypothetical protein